MYETICKGPKGSNKKQVARDNPVRKIIISDEQRRLLAVNTIKSLPLSPIFVVEVKMYKSTRSLAQNRTLWGWYTVIKKHIGESTGKYLSEEDLHDHFTRKFLPCEAIEIDGETIVKRTSTSKMDTAKMAEYMNTLDMYCVETYHLYLPIPGGPEE